MLEENFKGQGARIKRPSLLPGFSLVALATTNPEHFRERGGQPDALFISLNILEPRLRRANFFKEEIGGQELQSATPCGEAQMH